MTDVGSRPRLAALARPVGVVVGALAYIAALHLVYEFQIAPQFSYLQYTYRSPETLRYALAVGLAVGLALAMPRRIVRPSHFILWVLFVVAVIPSLVVPQIATVLAPAEATELALWITASFGTAVVLGSRGVLRGIVPQVRSLWPHFWPIFAVVALLSNAYLLLAVGLDLSLPSFSDVYEVRDEFSSVEDSTFALGYVVPLMAGLLHPVMLVRGFWGRRWLWVGAGLLGQVIVYAASGNKTAIFSPLAVLLAFLLFRASRRPPGSVLLVGAAVLSVVAFVGDRLTATNDWTSLLVRRFLVTPGLLTGGYVAVFDDIDKAHFGYSFLSGFVKYTYLVDPQFLVGAQFIGNPDTNANANLLADGYANFGYPGMFGECLVFVVVLWLIDDASRGIPLGVSSLVFLMPTLALADSSIFTAFLTHGFFAAIVLCMCAPRTGWGRQPTRRPALSPSSVPSVAADPIGR